MGFLLLGPLVTITLPLVYATAKKLGTDSRACGAAMVNSATSQTALQSVPNFFKRDFAWFLVAIVLASTSTASYTFILLLLPVILLLDEESMPGRLAILGCYVAAAMPLRPAWVPFFPKVWVLLALYSIAGRGCGKSLT